MFVFDDCIALLTSRTAKNLSDKLERRLQICEITRVQFFALYYIHEKNGTLTQHELAELMGLKSPSVARLLNRMEKERLVYRTMADRDHRVNYPLLTEQGEKLLAKAMPVVLAFKEDCIRGISPEDLDTYVKVLHTMEKNTEKQAV